MKTLSVIIPSRECPYLAKTLQCILDRFVTDYEILVNIDGPVPDLIYNKRINYFYSNPAAGMRSGINTGLYHAKGKYVMKCDDHCLFDRGFDKKMLDKIKPNQIMTARRYSLNGEKWRKIEPARDYHYFHKPMNTDWGYVMPILDWKKEGPMVDDTLVFQGSCWLAEREDFLNRVGYLDAKHYGEFGGEQLEVCLTYWTSGGEVKINKHTWYAHLNKGKKYYRAIGQYTKVYKKDKRTIAGRAWATNHWLKHNKFIWLINKFKPPTWEDIWQ